MATVTHRSTTTDTANASPYATGSFTPPSGELLAVGVTSSGVSDTVPTLTSTGGPAFTRIIAQACGGHMLYLFLADAATSGAAMTLSFAVAGAPTGAAIYVAGVSGMSLYGASASRQSASASAGAGTTPGAVFASAALTGNPILGWCTNSDNPAALTPPAGMTEQEDNGYLSPTRGFEYASRDSGFTGTAVDWGATSASLHGEIIVELDTSAAGGAANDDFFRFF